MLKLNIQCTRFERNYSSWYPQSNEILLNPSMKCWTSTFNAQGSKVILVVVQVGAHKRFSTRGNDPTEGLALMAKRFKKTGKKGKKLAEKLSYAVKIWQKFLCHWMQPGTLNLIQ